MERKIVIFAILHDDLIAITNVKLVFNNLQGHGMPCFFYKVQHVTMYINMLEIYFLSKQTLLCHLDDLYLS